MVFGVFDFLQKTNEGIRLYYYDTSSRLVFVRFLEEIEDIKKPKFCSIKGQIISKWLFGVFNFLQKTNENKLTWGFIVVK